MKMVNGGKKARERERERKEGKNKHPPLKEGFDQNVTAV